jgi:hypothetical protein
MGDPLIDTVFFLHKVFIGCSVYILGYFMYSIYAIFCLLFGFYIIFKIDETIAVTSNFIFSVLYKIAIFILYCLIVLLLWIFVHWMAIIIFVPLIIVIPIPIFPFVFIIPLKPLMLALIPPFQTLTDTGTLPLIYKLVKRLFNEQVVTNFLNYYLYPSLSDIGDYFYYNVNELLHEILGDNINDYFKQDTFKNKNKTEDDPIKDLNTNDNPDDNIKYNEYKENSSIKIGMKRIEEDTNLCIKMRQKFKPYNSTYLKDIETDMDNSFSPYNECYTQAIKSYLKTSIN